MKFISCGIFDKNYIYFFIIFFFLIILILFPWEFCNQEMSIGKNISFNMFFQYLGQIFCFIPERIINKFIFKQKEKPNKLNNLFKREKKTIAIELIFNDFSNKLTYKDIIYIIFASLLILISDYIDILIKMSDDYILFLNEQYYFVILLLLIIFSYLIYRIRFYKHQIISISFIILLSIIRYTIKLNIVASFNILNIFLELISTFFESIIIVYIKGLMEYKFFSPFKICYVFGAINSIIIIILSAIFFFLYDNNDCYFNGKETCYLDNLFKKFSEFGFLSFVSMFLYSIIYGIIKMLFCYIINKYTIFHIFLFIQNREFTNYIYKEHNMPVISFIIMPISYILEFFMILVFLEIIELNFWGLNENVKRKIKDRADDEMRLSLPDKENENEERNPSFDNSFDDNKV